MLSKVENTWNNDYLYFLLLYCFVIMTFYLLTLIANFSHQIIATEPIYTITIGLHMILFNFSPFCSF